MRQAIRRREYLPFAFVVQADAVFGGHPHTVSVRQYGEYMVVRQAIGSGKVLPLVAGHIRGHGEERKCDRKYECERGAVPLLTGNWQLVTGNCHSVLKYSIRSFNSSFCKSLVTPCVSCGLKTVQISSIDFAD